MANPSLEVVRNHTARWLRELTPAFGLIQPWGVWRRDSKGRN